MCINFLFMFVKKLKSQQKLHTSDLKAHFSIYVKKQNKKLFMKMAL